MRSRVVRTTLLAFLASSTWIVAQQASPELPFTFQKNVMVPMRDGTQLAANIFLPKDGGPFPVILMRTPYGKMDEKFGEARRYCPAGYAMVVQDCRGRGSSQGTWEPFRYDSDDGFDTQEWVGIQPWCNGHIGTSGGSYVGWTQWSAAPRGSRFLTCMVPGVPFTNPYREITYLGGAFQLSLAFGWGMGVGGLKIEPAKLKEAFSYLPLKSWDEQGDKRVFFMRDWVAHPTYDDYWRARTIDDHFERVTVPALNVGGWYDIFSQPTLDHVAAVRHSSTNRLARRNQFVVMGPWGHGIGGQKLGELDFGAGAKLDLGKLQFEWFEYWLKGKETGVQDWPHVRLFVMGENVWRNEHEWPLARTQFTPWYLRGAGKANTRSGDGALSPKEPETEPADKFTYDPASPVPTKGGNNLTGPPIGPFDQSTVEERADVLVYTSSPLEKAVEVTGPVKVILHAASSARDTDFTAKLVDVHPDGKAYLLCDGIRRARYRESFTAPTLIEPGKTYRYEIDLWVTSNLFKPGHRIRVEISSSNFPRFDRNPNTGHDFGADAELVKAEQTILHDREHPSHIVLPIIPR
ncbi:MAG: CocE/NonD family hydrolase [Verrucomicrobia bacterium]|nr:CocE/NonD family hydrolase [Verrucomicrobiota bacterium]